MIKIQDNIDIEKIKEETKHLLDCNHENIMKVYSSFFEKDFYYIIMELIDGKKLTNLLDSKELSEQRISEILRGILEALDYLHKLGKIHRDIKSDNVMVNFKLILD
jgi:serine/threonine protein kinase